MYPYSPYVGMTMPADKQGLSPHHWQQYASKSHQWHETNCTLSATCIPSDTCSDSLCAPAAVNITMAGSTSPTEQVKHQAFLVTPISSQIEEEGLTWDPQDPHQCNGSFYPDFSDMGLIVEDPEQVNDLPREGSVVRASIEANQSGNSHSTHALQEPDRRISENSEELCSPILGKSETCAFDHCGPNAPCHDFTSVVPIEGYASSPRVIPSSQQQNLSRSVQDRSSLHSRLTSDSRGFGASGRISQRYSTSSRTSPTKQPSGHSPRQHSQTETIITKQSPTKRSPLLRSRARQAHSLIERKYRENLNLKISQLHQTLEQIHSIPPDTDTQIQHQNHTPIQNQVHTHAHIPVLIPFPNPTLQPLPQPSFPKTKKSEILTEAITHIKTTELQINQMAIEIARLNERIRALERSVQCEDCSLLGGIIALRVRGTM